MAQSGKTNHMVAAANPTPSPVNQKNEAHKGPYERIKNSLAGIISGGADNDPAAITTYSIAGATTGYSQLWLMVLATPMLIAIQGICARIGDVTHKGVGQVIREHFPRPISLVIITALMITTILMIGADLIAIGTAIELMVGLKFIMFIVPIATIIWLLVLFTRFETFTKYLAVIIVVFVTYIISAFLAHPNWAEVGKNIILPPIQFKLSYISAAVGILGATFTPSMFFWQAQAEIEAQSDGKIQKAKEVKSRLAPGFIFGQIVTLFIMIATAATLYVHHQTIHTAADAAKALQPFAGPAAKYLFAVGIIGAGFMAIPVLATSAGYMVAEVFGWKQSLSDKVDTAKGFYIIITIALFAGVEIAISGFDPIQAMFDSQILAGIVGPFVMALLLIISNNRRIMGKYTNKAFDNIFGGLALFFMSASTILFIIQTIQGK